MLDDLFGIVSEPEPEHEKEKKETPTPAPEPEPEPEVIIINGRETIKCEGKLPCLSCGGAVSLRRTKTIPIDIHCSECSHRLLRQQTFWNGIELPGNITLIKEVTLEEWEEILEARPRDFFQIEQIAKIGEDDEKEGIYILYVPTDLNGIEQIAKVESTEMDRTSFFKKGLEFAHMTQEDKVKHIRVCGAAIRALSDMQAGGMRALLEMKEAMGLSPLDPLPDSVPRTKAQHRAKKGTATKKQKENRKKFEDLLAKKLGSEGFDSSSDYFENLVKKSKKSQEEEDEDDG